MAMVDACKLAIDDDGNVLSEVHHSLSQVESQSFRRDGHSFGWIEFNFDSVSIDLGAEVQPLGLGECRSPRLDPKIAGAAPITEKNPIFLNKAVIGDGRSEQIPLVEVSPALKSLL